MKTAHTADESGAAAAELPPLTGSHRRTLEAIFRHPSAHNLGWSEVVDLMGVIGGTSERSNNEFVFELAGKRHIMHKPHTKDLTSSEVIDLRHFLTQAALAPDRPSQADAHPDPAAPDLLVVVDHHGARIFHVDLVSEDTSNHVVRPYDPHHFLHHLMHKDQSRERGQRAPEEPQYYQEIAAAVARGGRIVVVGHGAGKSNAAHHLVDYLKTHHRETYRRIVREVDTDLSAITAPQLLDLARAALGQ